MSQLSISIPVELTTSSGSSHPPARAETPYREPISEAAQEPILPPSQEVTNIEPLYVSSQRELDDAFRSMQPHFEGRESEANWMARDNSVLKLRRYLKGNAFKDYQTAFIGHIRHMLDCILKVVNSLRTTMSTNGCHLVQELAHTFGSAIDPMVEVLMQNMTKLCSATKNIAAQNGNATIDVLLNHVTYNVRLVQHIWQAVQDKNVQPRIFAAGWLKTLVRRQTHNKTHFEHTGGLELVEKSIKKGLSDANPKVRETMRGTFWAFAQVWEDKGDAIINTLDAKSRQLLERDSANPNASQSSFTSSVGPGSTNPRVAASTSRSNLKETIAAQKKAALAARKMPDRPNSAMANLSPLKDAAKPPTRTPVMANNQTTRGQTSTSTQPSSTRPPTTGTGHGSLMSGPVRRPKRPDVARPATADPYANRRLLRAESPSLRDEAHSPTISSGNSSHAYKKSQPTSRPGTSGTDKSSSVASPHGSPAKQRPRTFHGAEAVPAYTPKSLRPNRVSSSPSADDNTTTVQPGTRGAARSQMAPQAAQTEDDRPLSGHSVMPSMAEEDNFTLVMPSKIGSDANPDQTSQSPRRAPSTDASSKKASERPTRLTHATRDHSPHVSRQESTEPLTKEEMEVHEDESAGNDASNQAAETPEAVLQELAPNEQNVATSSIDPNIDNGPQPAQDDIRSVSPTKKGIAMTMDGSNQDGGEVMKNRRILSSGIERLKAKTLDAHGFRRLQDLVKLPAHDSARLMSELLLALTGYIEATAETLRVNAAKAISLKSQGLATLRSVASLHKASIEVRQEFSHAVCSTLVARQMVQTSPHFAGDLERTAHELVKHAGGQVGDVLDAVLDFVSRGSGSRGQEQGHSTTMALSVLSRLQVAMRQQSRPLNNTQKQQLGKVAVRFLEDGNPDVRRADTELCLEMFGHFGEEHKEEFWALLKGAREAQLNLVAYYLARRVQGAR